MTRADAVLIVEDEPKIADLLRDYLVQSGYTTTWLADGSEVIDHVRSESPDLVLLDLMLPGKDGLAICKDLRAFSAVPIIIVTARVDEIDRLLGLELGADDYVCKPFSPREVVARVKANLRRAELRADEQGIAYPGLVIDETKFQASIAGTDLELTPVEFRLLARLAGQPGRVFSREQLMASIYVDGRIVSDRTVDSHIKNLRQKLSAAVGNDEIIRSIYGVGYKLD